MSKLMILLIFIGGGLGTLANFVLTGFLEKINVSSPLITWLINILGCLSIGSFYVFEKDQIISKETFIVLVGGILTGFTNYALFSLDIFDFLLKHQYIPTILYISGTVGLGLIMTYIGIVLTRAFVS